jgi:sialate O-acetylesterase
MKPRITFLPLIIALLIPGMCARSAPITVACVGDSITVGMGAGKGGDYPDQLQAMLGAGYQVRNFGVSGTTLLHDGDKPYDQTGALQAALNFKADITILMLGANDTKPQNWSLHHEEFEADYRMLAGLLKAANPIGTLFVCRPTWIAGAGKYGINEQTILQEIPIIDKVATTMGLPEIDMHAAIKGHAEDLVDTVHPNKAGSALLAQAAYAAIMGKASGGPPLPSH